MSGQRAAARLQHEAWPKICWRPERSGKPPAASGRRPSRAHFDFNIPSVYRQRYFLYTDDTLHPDKAQQDLQAKTIVVVESAFSKFPRIARRAGTAALLRGKEPKGIALVSFFESLKWFHAARTRHLPGRSRRLNGLARLFFQAPAKPPPRSSTLELFEVLGGPSCRSFSAYQLLRLMKRLFTPG